MKHSIRRVGGATVAAAVVLLAAAPGADAAVTLKLSKSTGLSVGDTITVSSLTGLKANLASVAVGQCKPKITGTSDCNLSGSLLGTANAAGVWQPGSGGRSIKLIGTVGGTDCTASAGACVIGVTSLVDPTHILATVPLTFSSGKAGASPTPTSTSGSGGSGGAASPSASASSGGSLPYTGSPDGVPTFLLAALALVVLGGGGILLLHRGEH